MSRVAVRLQDMTTGELCLRHSSEAACTLRRWDAIYDLGKVREG